MRLTVYLYPSVIFVDKSLLGRTMIERDASEFGKRPSLINFVGNHISIRYHPYTTSALFWDILTHPPTSQWLAIVLVRHFLFPVPLGNDLMSLYNPKSIVEFKFCAIKAISGSYGVENSQNFLKKAKNL